MPVEPERNESRRAERRHTDAPSTLRANAAAPMDAIVHDVSQTGARIECATELDVGQIVSIGLAGIGSKRATIMWAHAGHYGCAFTEPLASDAADKAFTQQTVVRLGAPAAAPSRAPSVELQQAAFTNGGGWMIFLVAATIGALGLGVLLLTHVFG